MDRKIEIFFSLFLKGGGWFLVYVFVFDFWGSFSLFCMWLDVGELEVFC